MAPEDTPQGRVGLAYLQWMELMQADPRRDQQHDQDPGNSKQDISVSVEPGDQLNQCPNPISQSRWKTERGLCEVMQKARGYSQCLNLARGTLNPSTGKAEVGRCL